jgi:hypothetical protein
LFTERTGFWLKNNGLLGFIMPNTWLSTLYGNKIRDYILKNTTILSINHYSYFVFEDATVETDVYILQNKKPENNSVFELSIIDKNNNIIKQIIEQQKWIALEGAPVNIYETPEVSKIKEKFSVLKQLGEIAQIVQGTKPFQKGKGNPPQTDEVLKVQPYVAETKINASFIPLLRGSLINKYANYWNQNYWISYGDWLAEPRYSAKFEANEKIIIRQTGDSLIATYDNQQFIVRDNLYVIRDDNNQISIKGLLAVINSKLLTWYYQKVINSEVGKTMAQVKRGHLLLLPVIDDSLNILEPFADRMLSLSADLQTKRQRFLKRLTDNFTVTTNKGINPLVITGALEHFDELDFKQFLAELKKQKITLTLKQQDEWEEYFNEYKTECSALANQIQTTDREIDRMVYGLYGLTEEEIEVVEGGTHSGKSEISSGKAEVIGKGEKKYD